MKFEWDEGKSLSNLEKHKISFDIAPYLFNDSMLTAMDNRKDYGETRFLAYSLYADCLFNVVYTKRNDKIRIISVRKANEREKAKYRSAVADN